MKKIGLLFGSVLLLSACESGSAGAIGRELAKSYISNECHTELDNRQEWQMITTFMGKQLKTEWENKICGCAADEASAQLSSADLVDMLTTEGKVKVLSRVTGKTVTACVKRLYTDALGK